MRRFRRRPLAALPGARSGSSGVEFALVFPFVFLMLLGFIDFGLGYRQAMRVEAAARAGLEYARFAPDRPAGVVQAVQAATGLPPDTLTTVVEQFCECPTSGTPVSCTSGACGVEAPALYVAVQVTGRYDPIFALPGTDALYDLQSMVTGRVR